MGICSGFVPWALGKSCSFPFLNGKHSGKKLVTSQSCCFCNFYFEQRIGLRKCFNAHWKAVCGCWRANITCKMQQTFGFSPVGILQVEAGKEHFPIIPIMSPVSQLHTENVQTGQAASFSCPFLLKIAATQGSVLTTICTVSSCPLLGLQQND